MGGSRSQVVSRKLLGDAMNDTGTQCDSSMSSPCEYMRSLDSHSTGSRSTVSSVNVRIVGRGGAGARRRKISKGQNSGGSAPEMESSSDIPHVLDNTPVLRTVGRGGLGSRPKSARDKSKAVSKSREPSFELLDTRKMSKRWRQSLPLDAEVRRRPPDPSPVSEDINTIHFARETELLPADSFKASRKRLEKQPQRDKHEDSTIDLRRSSSLLDFRNTPSIALWNDNIPTYNRRNRGSKTKSKQRERRFSLLFSIFQNDATRKGVSSPLPSMSTHPSQVTLTSIETDPSYFFHGSGSPPSCTPPRCEDTDTTPESSSSSVWPSENLSFFQQESCSSSMLRQEELDECRDEENHEHLTPLSSQRKGLQFPSDAFGLHLSPGGAGAPGQMSPPDIPFQNMDDENGVWQYPPTMPARNAKSSRVQSWTGEWNAGLADVISALRELR